MRERAWHWLALIAAVLLATAAVAQVAGTQPPGTVAEAPPSVSREVAAAPSAVVVHGPTTARGAYAQVPLVDRVPLVDGYLKESCWEAAPVLNSFTVLSTGRRAVHDTEVRLVCDGQTLYVGFRCKDKPTEITYSQGSEYERDDPAILSEDRVEIFVAARSAQSTYYHLVIGRGGAILDEVAHLGPASTDLEGVQVQARTRSWAWEAEVAVPFASVGLSGASGSTFTANFARVRMFDGEQSSWCPARGSFHDQVAFGELTIVPSAFVAEILDLGDSYGELRGGSAAKLRLASPTARQVAPALRLTGGGYARTYELTTPGAPPSATDKLPRALSIEAGSAKRIEIAYRVPTSERTEGQIEVVDPATREVLFRSPPMALRNTWLLPPLQALADQLAAISEYVNSLPAGDPVRRTLSEELAKQTPKIPSIRNMVEAPDAWGSVDRWNRVRDAIVAAQRSIGDLARSAAIVKGRTPAEVASGTIPRWVLSGREWMRTADYNTSPDFQDVKPRAYCFASPGETEPITVLVTTVPELTGCTATLTDFVENEASTPATGSFPAAQATIHVVKCWKQAGRGREREPGAEVIVPELLVLDDSEIMAGTLPDVRLQGPVRFNVPAGETRQLWIDVTVPHGTPAGLYTSTLTVTPQGLPPRSIALLVKVLDLRLAKPTQKWIIGFKNTLGGTGPLVVPPSLYESYLLDIAATGFDQATLSDRGQDVVQGLQLRQAAGMTAPVTISMERVPPEQAGSFVGTIRRLTSGKNLPDFWFFTADDPRTAAETETALEVAKAVRASGGKTIARISPSLAGMHGDSLDVLVYSILQPDFENYGVRLAKGEIPPDPRVELYNWVGTLEDPTVNRLLCGFYVDKSRLDGVFVSSYQDLMGCPDPFDELASENPVRPQMMTYPSKNGPIPTIQWRACREGHDDMRYLTTLRQLIAEAEPYAANAQIGQAVARAREVLDVMARTIQIDWRRDLDGLPRDYYRTQRFEIAVRALRLQEALATVRGGPVPPPVTSTPLGATTAPTTAATSTTAAGTPSPPGTAPGTPAPPEPFR